MKRPSKKRASLRQYTPQNQLALECFESPFGKLDKENRWVKLSDSIPWDDVVNLYHKHHPPKPTGRPPLNPRVLIGSVIIKHLNDYDDRETIEQIKENIYLQYFLGFAGFTTESPFDASLFVDIRKKLTPELLQSVSERLLGLAHEKLLPDQLTEEEEKQEDSSDADQDITHKGEVLMDASVAPQGIAYPTDLNLLDDARMKSEQLIDFLWNHFKKIAQDYQRSLSLLSSSDALLSTDEIVAVEKLHYQEVIDRLSGSCKPRTYRQEARKNYLKTAQSKRPGKKKIRVAIGKQLRYLRRNIKHIEGLLDLNDALNLSFPLPKDLQRYYWIIQLLYDQQLEMYEEKKHKVENRLVSIHQPHVRPIVRGKTTSPTEFGAKIHLSMVDGYCFVDEISWDAFHEGNHLPDYVENYKVRYGHYPVKVLVDKLYHTRENRKWLKERGIKITAKPLGRPSKQAVADHIRPGERNPIEGKFGQGKLAYGLGRIRAKLSKTSESWVASILLVLNLVRWSGQALYCLIPESFSSDARWFWRECTLFLTKIEHDLKSMVKQPMIIDPQERIYRLF